MRIIARLPMDFADASLVVLAEHFGHGGFFLPTCVISALIGGKIMHLLKTC